MVFPYCGYALSLNIPPDIIVNIAVNGPSSIPANLRHPYMRTQVSDNLFHGKDSLNLMFPDLRARQTLVLSSYSLAKWQHGLCNFWQRVLNSCFAFACFALPLGIESSTNMSFVHTAYLVPRWISLLPAKNRNIRVRISRYEWRRLIFLMKNYAKFNNFIIWKDI